MRVRLTIIFLSLFFYCFPQLHLQDIEGNSYRTVQIGHQVWMGENLKVTKNPAGNEIQSYCIYNDTAYCNRYGRLYDWKTMMNDADEESCQGICPDGWHLPSDDEWKILIDHLGGDTKAGNVLKSGNGKGFGIVMAGNYHPVINVYNYIDKNAYFWTSTAYSTTAAWMRQSGINLKNINRSTVSKEFCFSVRCVKD